MASITAADDRHHTGAQEREAARRRRARDLGLVPIGWAARWLKVSRPLLRRLYRAGAVPGRYVAGALLLERHALAAYVWSRPRCEVETCGRRVLGAGPGCSRHSRHGRQHSPETREKIREAALARHGSELRGKTCEWCGGPFQVTARRASQRFCDDACATDWLHAGAGAGERRAARDDGQREWAARRDASRVELHGAGLIVGREAVIKAMPAAVPRSASAVSGYIAAGWLSPTVRLDDLRLEAFNRDDVTQLAQLLDAYPDGRLRRWNASTPDQARTRAQLYQARRKSTKEFGRMASRINRAGPKVKLAPDAEAEIRRLRADGMSLREIVAAFEGEVTLKQVRGALART